MCCAWLLQSFLTLCDPVNFEPASFLCPWDSPGKNTAVGCRFLFQGIFPTQEWKLRLLCWQADSLPLSNLGCWCLFYKYTNSICKGSTPMS